MRWLLSILLCLFLFSCAKKAAIESDLAGSWKRTETLMDIGNGSGQWSPVPPAEQTVVEFRSDGTLSAASHWYLSRFNRFEVVSGTQLRLSGGNDSLTLTYSLADKLTINFQCIEACRDRFTKVN